eukprot:1535818-Rhodomonas_salina.1
MRGKALTRGRVAMAHQERAVRGEAGGHDVCGQVLHPDRRLLRLPLRHQDQPQHPLRSAPRASRLVCRGCS